jgi:ferredoxin
VILVTGELPPELEAEAAAGVAACPERVLSLVQDNQAAERLGEQHV